jgi:hypothetical protein
MVGKKEGTTKSDSGEDSENKVEAHHLYAYTRSRSKVDPNQKMQAT